MRGVLPVTITDAILTSSTVIETTPAVYNGATTYALNDLVYVGTVGQALAVYKSLQNGNTGHTPASSPTWWQSMGSVYAEYAGGTSYALDDIVQVAATHRTYKSLTAANLGHAVTDTAYWQYNGPTNKWAMFDLYRNTQTTVPSTLMVVLTAGRRCNSIALGGLIANTASISVSSTVGGGVVYTASIDLNTREVIDFYTWCFEPFTNKESTVRFNLPPYTDAVITVTLTATSGNVSCGSLGIGNYEELGDIGVGVSPSSLNFSSITRDSYGNATLNPQKGKPLLVCTTRLASSLLTRARNFKKQTDAIPAIWHGLTDDTSDLFESMVIFGVWKKFEPVVGDGRVDVNFELEEI